MAALIEIVVIIILRGKCLTTSVIIFSPVVPYHTDFKHVVPTYSSSVLNHVLSQDYSGVQARFSVSHKTHVPYESGKQTPCKT